MSEVVAGISDSDGDKVKQFLFGSLLTLTANRFSQACLLHGVRLADHLMGVGAGSCVNASGEASVLRRIRNPIDGDELVIFDVGANTGQFLQMSVKALAGGAAYQMHCFAGRSKTAYSSLSKRAEGLKNMNAEQHRPWTRNRGEASLLGQTKFRARVPHQTKAGPFRDGLSKS